MRANADIKAKNSRLWFPPTPETGLGFPGMLNSHCSWAATKRDFCILPHALWLGNMLDKPRNTWLELEHKNGNSNKKHDHCSSRDFHLSQINTWNSTFQKLPSQDQVSQMIWAMLSCCHMFYSMTNGHKTPQTSNIFQKNTLVQAHRHSKAISRTGYKTTTGREANLRLCLREIRICSREGTGSRTSATSPYSKSPGKIQSLWSVLAVFEPPWFLLPWGVVYHWPLMRCSQIEKPMSSISRIKEFRPSFHAGFDTELYCRGETLLKSPKFQRQREGGAIQGPAKGWCLMQTYAVWAARTLSHWKRCRHTQETSVYRKFCVVLKRLWWMGCKSSQNSHSEEKVYFYKSQNTKLHNEHHK